MSELLQELRRDRLVANLRRFVPEVGPDDIVPGPAGIRAQALGRDGSRGHRVAGDRPPCSDRAFERFELGA